MIAADQLAVLKVLGEPATVDDVERVCLLGRLRTLDVVLTLKRLGFVDVCKDGMNPTYAASPAGLRALRRSAQTALF